MCDLIEELLSAVRTGSRTQSGHRHAARQRGAEAAGRGVTAACLIDVHLTLAARLIPHLPAALSGTAGRRLSPETQTAAVQSLLWVVRDTVEATVEGFADVRRELVLREAAMRREFVDDLLSGSADVAGLVERATLFGLTLGPPHVVAAVRCDERYIEESATVRLIGTALRGHFGERDLLVATKDGVLVCVVPAPPAQSAAADPEGARTRRTAALRECLTRIGPGLSPGGGPWQAGIGGAHSGATGVQRSYVEAREALRLADRLGITDPVVEAADLLVYRVLLRDRAAMADLVTTVLGPLRNARGGAEPFVETLLAYFDSRGVGVVAAQRLFLSVRALTYRLERIRILTGYDINDPHQRFTLQAAALGARLLGWPEQPLP